MPGAELGVLKPREAGPTTVPSVTLLCPLGAHCSPGSVGLPSSQFPDHSGNGRNVSVTSMVTFEVTVTGRTTAQGRGEAVGGRGSVWERVGNTVHTLQIPPRCPHSMEKTCILSPSWKCWSLLPACPGFPGPRSLMIAHTHQGCRQASGSTQALGPSSRLIGVPLGPWAREAAEKAGGQPHSPTGLGQAPLALLRSPPSMAPGDKQNHGELAGRRLPQQVPRPNSGRSPGPSLRSHTSERQNAVWGEGRRNPQVPSTPHPHLTCAGRPLGQARRHAVPLQRWLLGGQEPRVREG